MSCSTSTRSGSWESRASDEAVSLQGDIVFTSVRVAAISLKPKKWDKDHNADRLERYLREAARQSPELILATEGMLDGYGVMEVLEGRRTPEDMLAVAEPIDGPYIERFRSLARELRACLCFGFAELIGTTSTTPRYSSTPTARYAASTTRPSSPRVLTRPATSTASAEPCGPSTPHSAGPGSSSATTAGTP